MKVVSLNVGLPTTRRYGGRAVFTGAAKGPAPRAMLRITGFDGDGQGDRENHGGPDKAVCVYSFDRYPHWESALGRGLSPGAFSENLTVSGVWETEVCVGDVFVVGGATVQVSTPRVPCAKVAGKNGEKSLVKWMAGNGFTGFYMRVLEEGEVCAGDPFELVELHRDGITIADVNEVIYERSCDRALIERLAALPEFGEAGRAMFTRRLESLERARVTSEPAASEAGGGSWG